MDTAAGNLLIGFFAVSAAFLYEGIEKDIKTNDNWDKLKENLPIFLPVMVAAGFIMETANIFYLDRWWFYLSPWSLYGPFGTRIGPLLLIGWLIMIGVTISVSYILVPLLGYVGTGLFTYFAYIVALKLIGPRQIESG